MTQDDVNYFTNLNIVCMLPGNHLLFLSCPAISDNFISVILKASWKAVRMDTQQAAKKR